MKDTTARRREMLRARHEPKPHSPEHWLVKPKHGNPPPNEAPSGN